MVVPVSSRLAKDILLANDSPGSLPAVCLDRLGLPEALKPGGRYLVAAHDTWEGEQAALPPTKSSKTTRKAFERLAREAAFVDQFKAEFVPTDSFTIDDHGETFEIVVQHASAGDATGGAEQYILDKKTGKWKMGWHEHPLPK